MKPSEAITTGKSIRSDEIALFMNYGVIRLDLLRRRGCAMWHLHRYAETAMAAAVPKTS
jgi:hypothetical protein